MTSTQPVGSLNTEREKERPRPTPAPAPAGGAVYGLGLIGALVWFWRQSDTPQDRALGVLKAVVWPAFLVYDAFQALHGLRRD